MTIGGDGMNKQSKLVIEQDLNIIAYRLDGELIVKINVNDLPDDAMWIAIDSDGFVAEYTFKPNLEDGYWSGKWHKISNELWGFPQFKDSLWQIQRPTSQTDLITNIPSSAATNTLQEAIELLEAELERRGNFYESYPFDYGAHYGIKLAVDILKDLQ